MSYGLVHMYDLLGRFGLSSPQDYDSWLSKSSYGEDDPELVNSIIRSICGQFSVPDESDIPQGKVYFIFGPQVITGSHRNLYIQRASFQSAHSCFVSPYRVSRVSMLDGYDQIESHTSVPRDYVRLLLEYRELILKGYVSFPPLETAVSPYTKNGFVIRDNRRLLNVEVGNKLVRSPLGTSHGVRVHIPYINGIPASAILRLHSECIKEIEYFRDSLARVLENRIYDGDSCLIEALQQASESVNQLKDKMSAIRRKLWIASARVSLGLAPTILSFVAPPEYRDFLRAVAAGVGSVSLIDLVGAFFDSREQFASLKKQTMIVPWRLMGASQPGERSNGV
jgi:hypothetical protein